MLKHHAQNDVMLEMQKCSYTWSMADMFIRVSVQNLLSHKEFMMTATQQTFLINYIIICKDIRSSST